MVLVDTSVWVKHLRDGEPVLGDLLEDGLVMCHPFIVGELACGNLRKRTEILALLQALPMAVSAEDMPSHLPVPPVRVYRLMDLFRVSFEQMGLTRPDSIHHQLSGHSEFPQFPLFVGHYNIIKIFPGLWRLDFFLLFYQ